MRIAPIRIGARLSGEDAALGALYPRAEPYCFTADDVVAPLTGVSAFPNDAGPHWHYVGFGLRDRPAMGFELTFRLTAPARLLAAFAAHARRTRRPLAAGHYLCLPEPLDPRGEVRCGAMPLGMFQRMVDAAPAAMLVLDREGRVAVASAEAERLFGYPVNELLGRTLASLVPSWDRGDGASPLDELLAAPAQRVVGLEGNLRCVTRRGERVPIEVAFRPIESQKGLRLLASITDIGDRQKQAALLATYERMVELAPNAMVLVDSRGRIEVVNRNAERLFGYAREELMGRPLGLLIPLDSDDVRSSVTDSAILRQAIGLPDDQRALSIRTKDGRLVPVELGLSAVDGAAGKGSTIVTFVDMTERNRHERELRHARDAAEVEMRVKAVFLASMSHEIRTPLNAVIGMTSLLLDSELTDEQRESAATIRRSGGHLLAVINDILDFSKIAAGKVELERQPFSVRECVESALDLVALEATDKNIALGYRISEGVSEGLYGDVARVRQVLLNLLSNAVKFTPKGGNVTIEVSASVVDGVHTVELAVRDTGIGVGEEEQRHLFQPFSQAAASSFRLHGGTGLGLSICARLCEMMGGRIWMQSEAGQGATFRFRIAAPPVGPAGYGALLTPIEELRGTRALIVEPADVDRATLGQYEDELGSLEPEPLSTDGGRPLRILVAEDHVVNQRVLQLLLRRLGHEPDFVATGLEALAAVERQPYDVVFMDVHMPEMNGLQATREICRRVPACVRPTIIGLSANALPEHRRAGVEAGMVDYLPKPITLHVLRGALARIHRERRLPRSASSAANERPSSLAEQDRPAGHAIEGARFGQIAMLAEHDEEGAGLTGLVSEFLSHGAGLVADIVSAQERDDADAIQCAAHTLKSSAAMFGALEVAGLCAQLEKAAGRDPDACVIAADTRALVESFDGVDRAFRALFPTL